MEVIKHDQAKKINYFNLFDFIDKIKLSPSVLDHMQETNLEFDNYFKRLSHFDDEFVLYFWISLAYDEIKNSRYVENHLFSDFDLSVTDLFFDRLNISHNRIHNIHKFIMKDDKDSKVDVGNYRKNEVKVSHIDSDGEEIFWYGAQARDVKKFMDTFLQVYKSNTMSVIDSNPFLKSALVHLLFVKIHPYGDGNGRTARMLHNIKFTETFNKIYNMNLKVCPVNLSQSINVNLISYVNAINGIYFDLDHDNNDMLNYWFNFILNMYDEQLFKNHNMIDDMDDVVKRILKVKQRISPETIEKIEKIKLRR